MVIVNEVWEYFLVINLWFVGNWNQYRMFFFEKYQDVYVGLVSFLNIQVSYKVFKVQFDVSDCDVVCKQKVKIVQVDVFNNFKFSSDSDFEILVKFEYIDFEDIWGFYNVMVCLEEILRKVCQVWLDDIYGFVGYDIVD